MDSGNNAGRPSTPYHWMKALVDGRTLVNSRLERFRFFADGNLYESDSRREGYSKVRMFDLNGEEGYRILKDDYDLVYEEAMGVVAAGGFAKSETGTLMGFGLQGFLTLIDGEWVRSFVDPIDLGKLWKKVEIGHEPVMCGDPEIDRAAKLLDGSNYPLFIGRKNIDELSKKGLEVVYGSSNDMMEFSGVFSEEFGAFGGCVATSTRGWTVKADWNPPEEQGTSWVYRTAIPHSEFRIMEGAEVYCYGIVFRSSPEERWTTGGAE